jgi:hypothetical protein
VFAVERIPASDFLRPPVGGDLESTEGCLQGKNAVIWVPEPEEETPEEITYAELHRRVNEFAALLKEFGGVTRAIRRHLLRQVPQGR